MRGAPGAHKAGFTLIEMMVTIAISMMVIAGVAGTFTAQTRQNKAEEEISQMHQNVRGALDLITHELMQAGYKAPGGSVTGVTYNTTQLLIQADHDGDNTIDTGNTSLEYITYVYDATNKRITRKLGSSGTAEIVADNITQFDFAYKQADGTAATSSPTIRKVTITITGRTQHADPSYSTNSGYRTYQLSADIAPPNLAL